MEWLVILGAVMSLVIIKGGNFTVLVAQTKILFNSPLFTCKSVYLVHELTPQLTFK
jgi:hypothetical protein